MPYPCAARSQVSRALGPLVASATPRKRSPSPRQASNQESRSPSLIAATVASTSPASAHRYAAAPIAIAVRNSCSSSEKKRWWLPTGRCYPAAAGRSTNHSMKSAQRPSGSKRITKQLS